MMFRSLLLAVVVALSMIACFPTSDCLDGPTCARLRGAGGDNAENDGGANGSDPPSAGPQCTVFGRAHLGLGGVDLAAKDDSQAIHADRARVKPYSALVREYDRVLGSGNHPSSIDQTGMAGTFGVPEPRWFLEPIASAVYINTAFNVAFEGCRKLVASDPTNANRARTEQCAAWARKFWSRDASPDEIKACAAVEGEPAYACASVLTSTGFLAY